MNDNKREQKRSKYLEYTAVSIEAKFKSEIFFMIKNVFMSTTQTTPYGENENVCMHINMCM
jgi:hypothetical protein